MRSRLIISPIVKRALAVAILGGVLCTILFGVIVPFVTAYTDASSSALKLQSALSLIKASESELPKLREEDARLRNAKVQTIGLLESGNESLAAAELQNRVKSLVETIHGELQSTQVLAPRDEENLRRISVHCQIITADVAGLQQVLYRLESSSPLLFLENVDIRVRPTRSIGAQADVNAPLDVSFDLYGYIGRAT
jgi:general secretion pathway protein M